LVSILGTLAASREAAVDKELQTPEISKLSSTMLEATTNMAENLAQSEPFLRLKAAEARLNADLEALRILQELAALQQKIRRQQYSSSVSESDLKQLRALQNAVNANETIADFQMTQELAVAFLREVNDEISQLVSIDFASLTRRAGGCC
jgi:cell fate (sporulation/competence/biofilm development) regulator YlbF (YheA/YmcA/DUF963 family)